MRNKLSRQMPKAPEPQALGAPGSIAILGILMALTALMLAFPVILLTFVIILIAIALMTVVLRIQDNKRLAQLAEGREGESICTFARSFDYRKVDTWVIRAVFEGLQPSCTFGDCTLPLRATDNLDTDLCIDSEDLEDLTVEIVDRVGRSLDDYEKNPFYGEFRTVSDLVLFIARQPLTGVR